VVQVLQREIQSLKKVEQLKQDLLNQFDYSILAIFRTIDQFSHGKITCDNIRTFLLNFECASELSDQDYTNWVKRFDSNNDQALSFTDLANAMQIMTNYVRRDEIFAK
jgi:Ca2+-binding EF-hand superfamily protein